MTKSTVEVVSVFFFSRQKIVTLPKSLNILFSFADRKRACRRLGEVLGLSPSLSRSTTMGWPPMLVQDWEFAARCVLVLAPTGNGGCFRGLRMGCGQLHLKNVTETGGKSTLRTILFKILRTHRSISHFTSQNFVNFPPESEEI